MSITPEIGCNEALKSICKLNNVKFRKSRIFDRLFKPNQFKVKLL